MRSLYGCLLSSELQHKVLVRAISKPCYVNYSLVRKVEVNIMVPFETLIEFGIISALEHLCVERIRNRKENDKT